MAKKHRTVGEYTIRHGKDPSDPDSEQGWRVYEADELYDSDVWDSEDEAVEHAEELWCEKLKEEITGKLPDDIELLTSILKMLD